MIVVLQVQSIPCLRMLFRVNKAFNLFCRQRFVAMNREMEISVCDDVQHMLGNNHAVEDAEKSTFIGQILEVVMIRENLLRANQMTRILRVDLEKTIEGSRRQMRALREEIDVRLQSRRPAEPNLDHARIMDEFNDDIEKLFQKTARTLRVKGADLRARLRKMAQRQKSTRRKIEDITSRYWALAARHGGAAWIAGLRAAVRRIDAALAGRLRMGARTRARIELTRDDAHGGCRAEVRFVQE